MPATTNEIIDAANEANVFSVAVKWGYLGFTAACRAVGRRSHCAQSERNFRDQAYKVVILLPMSEVFLFR